MYQLIFKNDDFIVIDKNPGVDFHSKENQIGLAATIKNRSAKLQSTTSS